MARYKHKGEEIFTNKPKTINARQASLLIAILQPPYDVLVRVMIETGLRISDALRLSKSDIKVKRIKEQKTGKYKRLDFSPDLRKKLLAMPHKNGRLFFSRRYDGKMISRTTAFRKIHAAAAKMQFESSPHSMRRLYAKNEYDKSGDIDAVRKKLNHDNAYTTMQYFDLDLNDILRSLFSVSNHAPDKDATEAKKIQKSSL